MAEEKIGDFNFFEDLAKKVWRITRPDSRLSTVILIWMVLGWQITNSLPNLPTLLLYGIWKQFWNGWWKIMFFVLKGGHSYLWADLLLAFKVFKNHKTNEQGSLFILHIICMWSSQSTHPEYENFSSLIRTYLHITSMCICM